MSYKPKNILVTGGAGFIGSHFILTMLNKYDDITIINLDKLTYAANLNYLADVSLHSNYHFIKGDIGDRTLVSMLMQEYNIDTVINFAAESHVDRSIETPEIFITTNVLGTQVLLDCALKYWQDSCDLSPEKCRFHQISTDEVYGALGPDDDPFTEQSQFAPNSPYSSSKAAADHFVRAYHRTYDLPITISHCSNNYGAHQHSEKLIPKIIQCCFESKPIPIYNDGSNIRDWLFVDDHGEAVDAILHEGVVGQRYNVGGGFEVSNLELTKIICGTLDKLNPDNAPHENLITFVKDRPGHDWRYAINHDLLTEHTGWRPQYSFQAEIEKLIDVRAVSYAT